MGVEFPFPGSLTSTFLSGVEGAPKSPRRALEGGKVAAEPPPDNPKHNPKP